MSYKLVIAEKPSVAQSIAKVIGADKREDGYLEGKNGEENKITIPEGVDPELLMKVLGNPDMAALLTSLAKTMKV